MAGAIEKITCDVCNQGIMAGVEIGLDGGEVVCAQCFTEAGYTCQHCNCTYHDTFTDSRLDYDDKTCCLECFGENCFTCEDCDAIHSQDEECYSEDANRSYCENCFDNSHSCCAQCDNCFLDDNMVRLNCGTSYCQDCANNYLYTCDGCGDCYHSENDSYYCTDDGTYCESCYSENYFYCRCCGDNYLQSDRMQSEDSGEIYCADCFPSDEVATYCSSNGAASFTDSQGFIVNKSRRMVGIEIEYLAHYGASVDGGRIGRNKSDSSISDSELNGREFVFAPCNGDEILLRVEKICKNLQSENCRVNTTCGLHVHVDMRDIGGQGRINVFRAFSALESIFLGMVSNSRNGNNYCKRLDLRANPSSDRYYALNASAYSKHGTFEFRLHNGTLNSEKINSWIRLLTQFVDTFQHVAFSPHDIEKIGALSDREKLLFLFQQVKCPLSIKKYIIKRVKHFKRLSLQKVAA